MSSNPSWKHHFVPQFYMERFVGDTGEIWAYRRSNDRDLPAKQYPFASLQWNEDLYTVKVPEFENWFRGEEGVYKEIDNAAAPAFVRALRDARIRKRDQEALWRFMYTMQIRNPRQIDRQMKNFAKMEVEIMADLERKLGPPIPGRPSLSELTGSSTEAGRLIALGIAIKDKRYRDYFNIEYEIINASPAGEFVTSDYPLLGFPDIGERAGCTYFRCRLSDAISDWLMR